MIKSTIRWEAEDRKAGLNFGDLRELVQACMRRDMPDDATLTVIAGVRSQLQRVDVTGATFEQDGDAS